MHHHVLLNIASLWVFLLYKHQILKYLYVIDVTFWIIQFNNKSFDFVFLPLQLLWVDYINCHTKDQSGLSLRVFNIIVLICYKWLNWVSVVYRHILQPNLYNIFVDIYAISMFHICDSFSYVKIFKLLTFHICFSQL